MLVLTSFSTVRPFSVVKVHLASLSIVTAVLLFSAEPEKSACVCRVEPALMLKPLVVSLASTLALDVRCQLLGVASPITAPHLGKVVIFAPLQLPNYWVRIKKLIGFEFGVPPHIQIR